MLRKPYVNRPLDVLERRPRPVCCAHQSGGYWPYRCGSGMITMRSHAKHLEILVSLNKSASGARTLLNRVTPAARPSSARMRLPVTRSTATGLSQKLLAGRDQANIRSFISMLHDYKPDSPYRRFMPPMVGTKQDIERPDQTSSTPRSIRRLQQRKSQCKPHKSRFLR